MGILIDRIQRIRFTKKSAPFALLAALVLAFGLLIPWLGYYHDEWRFIYYHAISGTQGLINMFTYDGHPLSVWVYILSFNILGVKPLAWHIYSLLWRWLGVSMFWLLLDQLWPESKRFSFIAALLFAIYPIFVLQVLPISYYEIWIGFFMIFLSFFFTVQAIRKPEKYWLFTALAIATKLGQMLTSEYTWGLELMRPIVIWFMLPQELTFREKIFRSIKVCLPYLAIFAALGLWRGLFYQAGRKEIAFQSGIFQTPLQTAIGWIQHVFPDLALILFTSWYDVLQPANLYLGSRENLLIISLSILGGGMAFFYLQHLPDPAADKYAERARLRAAVLIGLVGLIFGIIPSYAIGYTVYLSAPPGNTRFALGAMPAAALLISALLELLISSNRARMGAVAILVGLSIGWHVRYTVELRDLWKYQANFYRQLSWRVPALRPGTALVGTGKFFPPIRYSSAILAVSGDYPTAMAINTIYGGKLGEIGAVPYWFFQSPEGISDTAGLIEGQHFELGFSGKAEESLFLSYRPQDGQCLQILSSVDSAKLPRSSFRQAREISSVTSLQGIDPAGQTDFGLLNQLIGPENTNSWCYYFEKADLAMQTKDWQAVTTLWKAAQEKQFKPIDGHEYIPFIVAFAQTGKWKEAQELTHLASKTILRRSDVYCQLWTRIADETQASPQRNQALNKISEILACQNLRQP